MTNPSHPGVFFACDVGSPAFGQLRSGLEKLTEDLRLHLAIFDQEARSDDGVLEKIERLISQSICLVADVGAEATRPLNVNVMMEVGLARGLSRPILLITHNPNDLPSNLKGRDIVKFPDCLRVGSAEYNQMVGFLKNLGRGLLEGREIRMFPSKSREYLELLKKINRLPGHEWFVSPELRSFLRPALTEENWLRDVRRVSPQNIERERTIRSERRRAFETNLQSYGCIDVYPLEAIKLTSWRGLSLTTEGKAGFLTQAIHLLEHYPLYQMVFVNSSDRQKYWIKDSEIGKFVIFEQWGYVDIRNDKEIGGLIMAEPSVVQSFKEETEKLIEHGLYSRDETIELLRRELSQVRKIG